MAKFKSLEQMFFLKENKPRVFDNIRRKYGILPNWVEYYRYRKGINRDKKE